MDDNERNNKIFLNGDIYIGDFKGLLPHGKGKYTWSDGTIYEGEWEEGKMTGKGQIHWPSGATYDGDFSGGYLHCFGTFTGVDGSVYRGVWRMNIQHGLGRKQYYNSDIYEGSWKEGVREGCGRYAWNAGDTYVGNWKAGKMSGRGVLKWANGDLFDGFWLDGLIHGSGFYRFADGGFYSGTWTRGLKDGWGKFYPAGSNLPSMPKCNNSISHCEKQVNETSYASSVTFEDFGVRRPSTKHSLSKKFFIGNIFRYSGRMSHRSMSTDVQCNLDGPARKVPLQDSQPTLISTSDDGEHEAQCSNLAYEREYVQGVLIKEKARNNSVSLSDKHNQRPKFQAREAKRRQGENIFKGHRNYYLMLDLQLGIRYTVGKITPVPMREVRSSDFGPQARITMYFPSKGSQFTPPHKSISFYWKDYCPMVFRNLREMFKLDAADYMMSICGDDGLRELSSPGKSGSIFYLSQDQKFVIKTLRRSELKILLKMLHKYYNHVGTYDNTMITKFFGLHRITLRGGKKVRFVVMGNMFCTELRIHRRYDLKGSSQGRSTDKSKINENTTLKDLDLPYVFHMDRSLRDSLFSQISVDCMFLESQRIMDYSLLLGLHFRAPEHLKFLLETSEALPNPDNSPDDEAPVGESSQRDLLFPPKGLILVTHDPQSVSNMPGAHIRGSTLRTSATGDAEADLLVPGTGRLRVQLGVNMPALANHKLLQDGFDSPEVELFEVYDVVLYLGIIDILQKYNIKKKIEHAFKSLQFDPLSISAVEPKLYAKRFINFLERVFPRET